MIVSDTKFQCFMLFFCLCIAPSPVTNVSITSYPDSLCVSWGPPVDNGGEQVAGYHIYLRNLDDTTSAFRKVNSPVISYQLLDQLSNATTYE